MYTVLTMSLPWQEVTVIDIYVVCLRLSFHASSLVVCRCWMRPSHGRLSLIFFHVFGPTILTMKMEKKEQSPKHWFQPSLKPSLNVCAVKA